MNMDILLIDIYLTHNLKVKQIYLYYCVFIYSCVVSVLDIKLLGISVLQNDSYYKFTISLYKMISNYYFNIQDIDIADLKTTINYNTTIICLIQLLERHHIINSHQSTSLLISTI